jgi:P4 family phage/plasmid primase-like protien
MSGKAITIYQTPGRRGAGSNPAGFTKAVTVEPGDTAALAAAVQFDNCLAEYEGGYRTGEKFKRANVVMADNDNTHSDTPADWIQPADIQAAFPGVMLYQYPSRNNWKEKDGRKPRPKFHNLFAIEPTADKNTFTAYMTALIERFPQLHFDKQVCSAAQLNFGVEGAEVTFIDGDMTLTEFFKGVNETVTPNIAIREGRRNSTLSHRAGQLLKKYGDTEQAHTAFLVEAAKCSPPLDDGELSTIWNSAKGFFHKKIEANPEYIAPEQYNGDNDLLLQPADYTDVGEALILAREYGGGLRHSPATKYIVYNGQVWQENEARAHGCLHDLTERQLEEHTPIYLSATKAYERAVVAFATAKATGSNADKERAAAALAIVEKRYKIEKSYYQYLLKCRDSKTISGILKEAQTPLEIAVEELDKNALSLNTPDGEVDLITTAILPHNPESYHTKITTVTPSNEGAELWRDMLHKASCGNEEWENYLQLIAGQAAVGRVYCENLIIAYGNGRNGKSTIFNTMARVMGDYSGQISAETLTTGRKAGKNWEIAELRGQRMIIAPELEEGTRLDASFVKKICSTDKILGEQKYKSPFTFEPSHTVILFTNHLPKIGSNDAGTWRRLIVIPFNAAFEGDNDIKNYSDYLFRHAGGAVLQWIIEGAKRFIQADYHIEQPECVKQAIAQYKEANDWLNNFIAERCEVDPRYKTRSSDLYKMYREHCEINGDYIRHNSDFAAALEAAGFSGHRTNKGVIIHGLKVAELLGGH